MLFPPLPLRRALPWLPFAAACTGPQSTLSPAGRDAEQIAALFWWMAAGAAVVWAGVMGLALYALFAPEREDRRKQIRFFIVGGGAVFPTLVLTVLLVFGLRMVPGLLDPGPDTDLRIRVWGEQWWWRVRYELPDGQSFELANEVHLPVARRTHLQLESPDVIHAFWVPALAGKVDMIPGRVNHMGLQPMRTGHFMGACTEYCGLSHAHMRFDVVVSERSDFEAWTRRQARPARPPEDQAARRGKALFASLGCGACHTVRGTGQDGSIGPDLTHVGSRHSLAAGALPNDTAAFARWLERPHAIKPGVQMPAFDMLEPPQLARLARYLEGLK